MRTPLFLPSATVIPADTLGTITEAREYLDRLRQLAVEANGAFASEQAHASEQGYAAGFARGLADALGTLKPAIAETRTLLETSQSDLAAIVLDAVSRIIGRMEPGEAVRLALGEAIAGHAGATAIELRVSSESVPLVEAAVSLLRAEGRADPLGRVVADPVLEAGEMVLVTPKGRVHVGLRQQIGRLRAGLDPSGAATP